MPKDRKLYRREWYRKTQKKRREVELEYREKHRPKLALQARLRYSQDREKRLDQIRFKKYGITGDEFRTILEKQGIKCPICNRDITKNPSVDHDHKTGKIRGLICNNCNLAIGNADDSSDRLRAMAKYLEEHYD